MEAFETEKARDSKSSQSQGTCLVSDKTKREFNKLVPIKMNMDVQLKRATVYFLSR